MALQQRLKIIIISDGTGETATSLARAAMAQFNDKDIYFTRYKNIRSREQILSIFEENSRHHHLVAHTLVSTQLRAYILELAREFKVRCVDLMGPMLNSLANAFNIQPDNRPGKLHEVNEEYFKRVNAVEFTVNHDDGQNHQNLHEADIILVGISRTSKTPLSLYLSLEGFKVINIPLIKEMKIPEKLFEVDQRKIFALTIEPDALFHIRSNRLNKLGVNSKSDQYASMDLILEEMEWANSLFREHKKWPVFDVTNKALEETASEIIRLINQRKTNRFIKN